MDENPQPELTPREGGEEAAPPPELPSEVPGEALDEAQPLPPEPSVRELVRDAVLDLVASLGTTLLLVMGIAAAAVIAGFWAANRIQQAMTSLPGIVVMLLATQLPLLFFAVRRLRRNRARGWPRMALLQGNPVRGALWGSGAGVLLTVISGFYSFAIQQALGEDAVPAQLDFLKQLLSDPVAVTVLTLVIAGVAPVVEELFFRGAIFSSAHAAGHTTAGAVTSALLFATVHFSPILIPFYATFALVMCWLLARTRTLAAPIAAHMTLNGVACLSLILSGGAS